MFFYLGQHLSTNLNCFLSTDNSLMRNRKVGCLLFSLYLLIHFLVFSEGLGLSDQLWLEVLYPSDIAFSYKIRPARNFGEIPTRSYNRIKLVPTDPEEGCSHLYNGEHLMGQVAFIKRGGCSFVSKSLNAELYGAVAAVICDNDPDSNTNWIDMIGDGTDRDNQVGIPVFFMLGKDGRMISQSIKRHNRYNALVNVPVNSTRISITKQPPWDFW